jgi:PilZ domain
MVEDRRRHKRFKIDCPVTVLTPGRGKKKMVGRGWLCDINDDGARFLLDQSLKADDRISVEIDFQNPDGEVTSIRFPGVVKRVKPGASYDIAVSFLKGGSFVRGKGARAGNKAPLLILFNKGHHWVN